MHHINIKIIEEAMITYFFQSYFLNIFTNKIIVECIVFSKMLNHDITSYVG